jgi:hypothetical protein
MITCQISSSLMVVSNKRKGTDSPSTDRTGYRSLRAIVSKSGITHMSSLHDYGEWRPPSARNHGDSTFTRGDRGPSLFTDREASSLPPVKTLRPAEQQFKRAQTRGRRAMK